MRKFPSRTRPRSLLTQRTTTNEKPQPARKIPCRLFCSLYYIVIGACAAPVCACSFCKFLFIVSIYRIGIRPNPGLSIYSPEYNFAHSYFLHIVTVYPYFVNNSEHISLTHHSQKSIFTHQKSIIPLSSSVSRCYNTHTLRAVRCLSRKF